jgi:hypothetical protein
MIQELLLPEMLLKSWKVNEYKMHYLFFIVMIALLGDYHFLLLRNHGEKLKLQILKDIVFYYENEKKLKHQRDI